MDIKNLTDIKLAADWQITAATTGDFLKTTAEYECILQEIQLEAQTQEGDLFYDEGFGWSLLDFTHTAFDDLLLLEITERIKEKLSWYEDINPSSVSIELSMKEDSIPIGIAFSFYGSDDLYQLQLSIDRVNAEVRIV